MIGMGIASIFHGHHRREEDIQKMLAAQVHIGTRNSDSQMQDYIWRRRQVSVGVVWCSCRVSLVEEQKRKDARAGCVASPTSVRSFNQLFLLHIRAMQMRDALNVAIKVAEGTVQQASMLFV